MSGYKTHRFSQEPDDYEGPWPKENAMTEWVMVPREPTPEMVLAAFDAVTNASGEGMIRARWRCMLDAAPAAPQQAEPTTHERVSLAYKNGYEEALNDCIRNGGEAWARSMFANNGEHIKPFAAIDLTTNQAVDPMGVLRARRALEGK